MNSYYSNKNNNKVVKSDRKSDTFANWKERKKKQQQQVRRKYSSYRRKIMDALIGRPIKFIKKSFRSTILINRKKIRLDNVSTTRLPMAVAVALLVLIILLVNPQNYRYLRQSHGKFSSTAMNQKKTTDVTVEAEAAYSLVFDPSTEFSPQEWLKIQKLFQQKTKESRALLLWPTIPVLLKGSDTRATDTIEFLSKQLGYTVDLLIWTEYAIESLDPSYDNSFDIQRIHAAGAHSILGPLDRMHYSASSDLIEHVFRGNNITTTTTSNVIIIVWLWPDTCYLQAIIPFIQRCKLFSGNARVISVVDDVGIASRFLVGATLAETATKSATFTTFNHNDYVLQQKQRIQAYVMEQRPLYLRGIDYHQYFSKYSSNTTNSNELQQRILEHNKYGMTLLYQEMYLYYMSDIAVGINDETAQFIRQMAPGINLFEKLVYVSPVQPSRTKENIHEGETQGTGNKKLTDPFSKRSGFIFFGYNNAANRQGLEWFVKRIYPLIMQQQSKVDKFHIAGTITHNNPICTEKCSTSLTCNKKYKSSIICHGAISDTELNTLIQSVKVAINPILEPSGVATKTCRAMALGTPVVTTSMDGTFSAQNKPETGAIVCSDEQCFADAIQTFLSYSSDDWKMASDSASLFIREHFGSGTFMRNWISILEKLSSKPIQVVIDASTAGATLCCTCADEDLDERAIQSSVNWILALALSKIPEIDVTIITKTNELVQPSIPQSKTLTVSSVPFTGPEQLSPFLTGFEANVFIRPQSTNPLPSYCGPSCRAIQVRTTSAERLHSLSFSPGIKVDATWWMVLSSNSDMHQDSIQKKYRTNDDTLVRVPIDIFTHSCTTLDKVHDTLPLKNQQFFDALKTIIYMELSRSSHREPFQCVLPYKLKTCLVGKFLARQYIFAFRAIRYSTKLCFVCICIFFLFAAIIGPPLIRKLLAKNQAHILPVIRMLQPGTATNKRTE